MEKGDKRNVIGNANHFFTVYLNSAIKFTFGSYISYTFLYWSFW
jgi:hypothetical protein